MERPILFSAPMVRAILEGRKTMTRRTMKKQPPAWCDNLLNWYDDGIPKCPYGVPGDRLWVRESFAISGNFLDHGAVYYKADERGSTPIDIVESWKPSIHMPRWASRITLEVVNVKVERLQEITEEDATREGIQKLGFYQLLDQRQRDEQMNRLCGTCDKYYVRKFSELWESINGPGSWEANPWVWIVEFKKVD